MEPAELTLDALVKVVKTRTFNVRNEGQVRALLNEEIRSMAGEGALPECGRFESVVAYAVGEGAVFQIEAHRGQLAVLNAARPSFVADMRNRGADRRLSEWAISAWMYAYGSGAARPVWVEGDDEANRVVAPPLLVEETPPEAQDVPKFLKRTEDLRPQGTPPPEPPPVEDPAETKVATIPPPFEGGSLLNGGDVPANTTRKGGGRKTPAGLWVLGAAATFAVFAGGAYLLTPRREVLPGPPPKEAREARPVPAETSQPGGTRPSDPAPADPILTKPDPPKQETEEEKPKPPENDEEKPPEEKPTEPWKSDAGDGHAPQVALRRATVPEEVRVGQVVSLVFTAECVRDGEGVSKAQRGSVTASLVGDGEFLDPDPPSRSLSLLRGPDDAMTVFVDRMSPQDPKAPRPKVRHAILERYVSPWNRKNAAQTLPVRFKATQPGTIRLRVRATLNLGRSAITPAFDPGPDGEPVIDQQGLPVQEYTIRVAG